MGRVARMALVSGLACMIVSGLSGCIVEEHRAPPPPALDTEIEFDESVNIGVCGDASRFSWTVSNRQTGEQGTAGCSQPVLFQGLAPNTTYTFDVVGAIGTKVCWQGSCNVDTRYGMITYADCSGQVEHLCGL
jgi:hypothetical protein